jgi:hypothetical protein
MGPLNLSQLCGDLIRHKISETRTPARNYMVITPSDDKNKVKWPNKNNEAIGLIKMSISPNLRFHLKGIDDPNDVWEKILKLYLVNTILFDPTSGRIS